MIIKPPLGRRPKLYQCLKCKSVLGAAAVRSHKCLSVKVSS